jgi:hypothetical protein
VDVETIRTSMLASFVAAGGDGLLWEPTHPRGSMPRVEEYSRCLDHGKFRVLAMRADAWGAALVELGVAQTAPILDPIGAWLDHDEDRLSDRAFWLQPARTNGQPLLFSVWSEWPDAPESMMEIGFGDPASSVLRLPFCGCDACDDGSEILLEEFDEHVESAVTGVLSFVQTDDWVEISTAHGSHGGGLHHGTAVEGLADCKSQGRTVHGPSWI